VIDFGCTFGGYNADITRSLILGEPTKRQKGIFDIVLRAQNEAIQKVREGIFAREIDQGARRIIAKAGYGKNFGHATGHGIGLDVHEGPRISKESKETIKKGMVFTIEPGIYIKNFAGVRIEDMVLATEKGCEVLSKDIPPQPHLLP
jgi:Xaa-Pro aminopeptidase